MTSPRYPLLALCCFACARPVPPPAPEAAAAPPTDGEVRLAEVSRPFIGVEPIALHENGPLLRAPAHVAFRDEAHAQLGAPFAGRVVRVHVQAGDTVGPNDPLVTLDCPDAAAARTALATATAAEKEARAALDREQRMLAQGVGIEREQLAAETRLSEAEAELARARSAAAFAGGGTGTTVVLRSPIAGKVIARKVTVGTTVQAGGEAIIEVGDPRALWVVADVFERDLPFVREGAKVQIELPSRAEPFEGTVASVGSTVTAGLRTVPVRIAFDATVADVRPGTYGRVRIASSELGLSLPTEAVLIRDGKETVVYVEASGARFLRRAVQVGQPVEGRVQVISGLTPGEKVVVKGALLLDGSADQLL